MSTTTIIAKQLLISAAAWGLSLAAFTNPGGGIQGHRALNGGGIQGNRTFICGETRGYRSTLESSPTLVGNKDSKKPAAPPPPPAPKKS